MKSRIHFLDNLRTFLIFLVILYHAAFVYQSALQTNWIVIDPVKSDSLGLVGMYIDLFVMFILFFISGYFIPNSIRNHNSWGLLKSKFKRIMVPWMVAVFTLIPAYKAIFLYSRGLPQEEWYSYFHFFQRTGADLSVFANNPSQHWLWFLPVLFLFQVLYLVLYRTNLLSIRISLKTGVFMTFAIGLLYSLIISSLGLKGWTLSPFLDFQRERLLVYFMVFLLGSLCYELRIFDSGTRSKKYLVISNVVLGVAITIFTPVALNLFFNMVYPDRNYFFVSRQVDVFAYYASVLLCMLSFLYVFIDLFRLRFNKSSKIMDQLNRNSYNVYIIHMIVLGIIALILVDLPIPIFVKYLVLTILTFIVCHIIVYAYRRILAGNVSIKTDNARDKS